MDLGVKELIKSEKLYPSEEHIWGDGNILCAHLPPTDKGLK